ncbi:MAG: outer membrane lipoprotein carrier protein LolA [Deltaproteobacteria bacterium]|nr:outer membrane lipoprotein carrier protein LolA [Deltaproteobacteria bacterium]
MKKVFLKTGATLVAASIIFISTAASALDIKEVIKGVQSKYSGISTVQASFKQDTYYKELKQRDSSTGSVSLKKPGKMKFVYKDPIQDEILSDGKKFIYYQPDIAQAVESPLTEGPPAVAIGFLMGEGDFEKDFNASDLKKTESGYAFTLAPKEKDRVIKSIRVETSDEFLVFKVVVDDAYGGETTMTLTNIRVNEDIKDSFFKFKTPKGVKIIKP